jgi:C-type mannose receptor
MCYQKIEEKLSYDAASKNCLELGGNLVTILDQAKQDFIVGLAGGEDIWLGMDDLQLEGTFRWASGQTVSYSNWNEGEPNNYGGSEDCGMMRGEDFTWNDSGCSNSFKSICEIQPGCPAASVPFGGKCYEKVEEELSYDDAKQNCFQLGGTLVTILDQAKQDFIAGLTGGEDIWLGLDDLQLEGSFTWSSGQTVSYSNWNEGEPNNYGGSEDCGMMRGEDFTWNDSGCSNSHKSICEIQPGCPAGSVSYGRKCYEKVEEELSYSDASANCANQGGNLVTILDQAKQNFVAGLAGGEDIWLGLDDLQTEGTFTWASGQTISFSNWNEGEPNNYGGSEDCGMMRGEDTLWNDSGCGNKHKSICEIQPAISCGAEYSVYDGKCIKKGADKLTYDAAAAFCASSGDQLVEIFDAGKQNFVAGLAAGEEVWLGLSDQQNEGQMLWGSGAGVAYSNGGVAREWRILAGMRENPIITEVWNIV